ncbi:hypothetical protein F441_16952 [Phytophthora nicotianae CJ01A1]|uniref:Uncharacterized protein n=2 Tax=Phytophthora nicotianae TaxID=4792 RepID=W2G4A8_PHYNI|nr:hypothetical protein L915_16618 [Phytophthora nicotianae]ETL30528.1 hypothetical protein L916_16521 [Phytophthora nicotianae]ETL83749.1 hypothetical protein L917_16344 [Phytophthora nicotianae]ETP06684.1 hypothetical protein F441_16952 [Phytophthora nicotianae CJ01A1]
METIYRRSRFLGGKRGRGPNGRALEDSWHCLVHLLRVPLSSETTGQHTRTTRRWHLVCRRPTWFAYADWSSRYPQSADDLASIVFGGEF